jgi:hypothetical protein
MRSILKKWLFRLSPYYGQQVAIFRAERHRERLMKELGVDLLTKEFAKCYGWSVRGGEFIGMELLGRSAGSALLPKLLGSYEEELQPTIRQASVQQWDTIVDIGCAEGFYAVGLAMLCRSCPSIYAFDITQKARRLCKELATLNHVDNRVIVESACDERRLVEIVHGKKCLIISDCEGFEAELFTKKTVSSLSYSDLIVELHERTSPGITNALLDLLDATHEIKLVASQRREAEKYPELRIFDQSEKKYLAVNEFRHDQQHWLIATSLRRDNDS